MKTWKVWFDLGLASFALEMKGLDQDEVIESAVTLARRLGASFNYEMEELK